MVLNGTGGHNTITGIQFESIAKGKNTNGINLTKNNLYNYLNKHNIDWKTILSKKILPDECYLDTDADELRIYEKKFQNTAGSVDEKPQTCDFKIKQFKKIADAMGIKNVSYTYIFNDWFKKSCYKDMLDYIKSIPGCDYYFQNSEGVK